MSPKPAPSTVPVKRTRRPKPVTLADVRREARAALKILRRVRPGRRPKRLHTPVALADARREARAALRIIERIKATQGAHRARR
jgi:hypothetical protein